uniref:serine hydrolase domain-containing protein n=1 Tax=Pseudonocardia acaciae TaxID=551276 RepID=UPI0006850B3C
MSAPTSLARRLESLAEACAGGGAGPAIALCAVRDRESALLCRGRVDEHTRFELGSVTKTFTALLLAEMAARGDVRYHDPISTYLPAGALPRGAYGARITLHDLATHTSGLPRVPLDLLLTAVSRWWTNPYATYSPERMLRSTARARIRRGPTTRPHYSNLGAGLLGHILGIAAGTGYPKALTTRVLEPLGLAHTTLDPDQPQATGHRHGRPRPAWRDPGLAAAGALRSTASDLLRYLQAHLTPDD